MISFGSVPELCTTPTTHPPSDTPMQSYPITENCQKRCPERERERETKSKLKRNSSDLTPNLTCLSPFPMPEELSAFFQTARYPIPGIKFNNIFQLLDLSSGARTVDTRAFACMHPFNFVCRFSPAQRQEREWLQHLHGSNHPCHPAPCQTPSWISPGRC